MNKAPNVKFSLRKLLLAMTAAGPMAILPSPVWATLPTSSSFSVTNGSATVSTASPVATITASDKAVLVWGAGNFNIASGETYNFSVPTGGSVLNKVGYNANNTLAAVDTAVINGTLLSTGRVFVLANGNVTVGSGAAINTSGGLFVSTLQETSDFNYTTTGNLGLTGNSTGSVTLGSNATAASVAGSLEVWSGLINVNSLTVSGDGILRTTTANQAISIGALAGTTVGGNLTVVTNNGAVTTPNTLTSNVTSFNNNGGNNSITVNGNFGTLLLSSNGTVTVTDSNDVNLGASSVGGALSVTATNSITTTGLVAAGNTVSLTSTTSGNVTFANNSTAAGAVSASAASGAISLTPAGNVTLGALSAGTVGVSSNGVVTVNGAIASSGNVSISGTSINQTSTGAVNATANVVNYTSTAGNIVLGNITANTLNVTANGSITQGSGVLTTTANGSNSFNAGSTGNISLTNANQMSNSTLTVTGNVISIANNLPVILGNTTAAGNVTINTAGSAAGAATIQLGANTGGTSSSVINVTGGLNLTTNNSAVSDDNELTIRVFGPVALNTAGAAVTLDSAVGASGRGSASYGQFSGNLAGGALTIHENQTLAVGTITAGAVTLNSVNSNILYNGTLTAASIGIANATSGNQTQTDIGIINVTGTSSFRSANNTTTGGTMLNNSQNVFGGAVTLTGGGNNIIIASTNLTMASGSNTNAANLTTLQTVGSTSNTLVVNMGNASNVTAVSAGEISVTGGLYRNLTLNASSTSATAITSSANFTANNTLTLTSAGNVTLGNTTLGSTSAGASNNITNVVFANVAGDSVVVSNRNLNVSGNSGGNVTLVAGANGAFSSNWNVTFGNLNVKGLSVETRNGAGNSAGEGISGVISQNSNTRLHVESTANFTTFNNTITLANSGNNFGRVGAFAGSGAISISEDGTMKVGNISTTASTTLTSRFGSIIEDAANAVDITVNGSGSVLTLNAASGSVLLGNTTHTAGATTGNVVAANVTASGAAALISTGSITLGNIAANSLSVTSGNAISQSGVAQIYGAATFNATNSISLTNAANNFGPVSLTTGTAAQSISIAENGTLNLRSVTMPAGTNGTFTATSANGDIIDSGLSGFKPGGTTASPGSGVVTLSAANGNIVIDDPTSDIPTTAGVVFNAKNVTLAVLGNSTLVLGNSSTASVATGNLTVTSALGHIANAGNVTVTGNAFFQTGAGNITLNQSGNQFGSVRFVGNEVSIRQSGDMKLVTGSSAIAGAQFSSGGNITVDRTAGGSLSFGNTVSMAATGSITLPKAIQAAGTLTVNAAGTKDLSALSVAGDLSGKNPVNLGTGTYLAPGQ